MLVCAPLCAGQAAAQFTISIPGNPNSTAGLRIKPQNVVPFVDQRSRQLAAPDPASGYSRNAAQIDHNRKVQLAAWEQAAAKIDFIAAYHVGRAFEMGTVSYPSRSPDMAEAVHWFNLAVQGGNLSAMYHLGSLMVTGNVWGVDHSGVASPNVAGGKRMMEYAVQHGYQPATDTSRTQTALNNNDTAATVAGAFAALIVLGAMANAGSSSNANTSAGSDSSSYDDYQARIDDYQASIANRACMITEPLESIDPTYPGTTTRTRVGHGYECY